MSDAKRVASVWRSKVVVVATAAILAAGCASDARNTTDLKTDTKTEPVTSYSPAAVAEVSEKPGREAAPALAEQSPGARALGALAPAAGAPADPVAGDTPPGGDLSATAAVNPSNPAVDPTGGLRGGPVVVTGTPVGGAGVAVGAGTVAAPATGAVITGGGAVVGAGVAGGTGNAVAGPANVGAAPATGIAATTAAAAGNGVTGIAGGALPAVNPDGTPAIAPGVAGPAVAGHGTAARSGVAGTTAAVAGAGVTGVAGGGIPAVNPDGTPAIGPGVAGPAVVGQTAVRGVATGRVNGTGNVTSSAVAPSTGVTSTTTGNQPATAAITNSGSGNVRVAPAAGRGTSTAAGTAATAPAAASRSNASGRTVSDAPRAATTDRSRVGISDNEGRSTPRIVETPRPRSIFPWRNRAAVAGTIEGWNALSQSVARQMIARYGQPDEMTDRRLIWHARRPWTRIEVMSETATQQEPRPDANVLVQTIAYGVTPAQAEDLMRFDGSLVVDSVRGEISARGESEAANLLVLNLVDEIVRGVRSTDDARRFFVDAMESGSDSRYRQRLLFARGN